MKLLELCRNIFLRLLVVMVIISSLIVPPAFCQETEDSQVFITGFNAYQQKDYASSIEKMNEVLQKYPDSPLRDMALFWLSRSYYKTGNQQDAARYLSQFTKEYPDNPLRSTVEDELLTLVTRYERGEKLPVGTPPVKQPDRMAAQKAKAEKERIAAAKAEEAKKAAAAAESARLAALKQAEENAAAEKKEAARVAAAKAEQAKIAAAKDEEAKRAAAALAAEAARVATLKQAEEKAAAEKKELERQAAAKAEQERVAAAKAEETKQAEAARVAALKAAEEKAAAEKKEQERLAAVKAEQERVAAAKAEEAKQKEAARMAALKAAEEKAAAEKKEQERLAAVKAEQERLAAAKAEEARQAEATRVAALKAAEEKAAAEKKEQERLTAVKAEQERVATAKAEEARQVEAARVAALKAAEEKAAAEKKEQERLAAVKAEQEQIAQKIADTEKAEQQRIAAIKAEEARKAAEQERAALAKAEEIKQAAAIAAAEAAQVAARKAAEEKAATEKKEQERIAAVKAEQERVARETSAREAAEQQRIAAAKAEEALRAAATVESARLAAQKAEAEHQINVQTEKERAAQAEAELVRMNALKEENERTAAKEKAERERIALVKAEEARQAVAAAEAARMASLKAIEESKAAGNVAAEAEKNRLAALKADEARQADLKRAEEKARTAKSAYREKAIAQYKTIIDKYPASSAAVTAAAKLRELGVTIALPPQAPEAPLPENAQVLRVEVAQFAGFEFNLLPRPDSFVVGRPVSIPFEVTNRGNGTDSFNLESAFPAGFKATFTAAAAPGSTITHTPDLAPGATFKGIIELVIPPSSIDGQRFTHPVKAASRLIAEASQSREIKLIASAPLLRAVLRTEKSKVLPGEKVAYRVAILNVGSTAAQDVTFRLDFPPQLEPVDFAAAGLKQESKSTLVLNGLQIGSGENREYTVTFQLKDDSLAGQELATRAELVNNPLKTTAAFISNTAHVEAQRGVVVRAGVPSLTVIPGQLVTVPFVVTNTGNIRETFKISPLISGATTAAIFNDLNRDGVHQATEPVITDVGPLAPREEANIVVEIKTPSSAADGTRGSVQVSFVSEADSSHSASGSTQLTYSRPVLKMVMAGHDGRLKPGDVASFVLAITNNGSNLARLVELQSVWPAQLELLASEPATGAVNNGTLVWRFKEVGAGEKRNISVSFRVKPLTGVGTAIQVNNILTYEDQLGNRY